MLTDRRPAAGRATLGILGAWLAISLVLHLVWEIAQLPFYSLWYEAQPPYIAWAVVHCTAGDGLIALGTYAAASGVAGSVQWPWHRPRAGLGVLWLTGVGWTAFSELRHVYDLASWAYAPSMPTIGGIGLAPLLQWVVVPGLALWCLRERRLRRAEQRARTDDRTGAP